jgi:hypothetical protein
VSETGLARYDAMVLAIAECERVDEVKEIRDKARALEVYAKQAMNTDAERQAARVRIRAERRSGELIIEQHNTGSLRTQGSPKGTGNGNQYRVVTSSEPTSPKLSDLGITRDQSSQWQKLAAAPASVFEKVLAVPTVPTTAGVLREIEAAEAKQERRAIVAVPEPNTCTVSDLAFLWELHT